MTEQKLCAALEQWTPPLGVHGLETCVVATAEEFRKSFAFGVANIFGMLAFGRYAGSPDGGARQGWDDYVCSLDDASLHAGVAAVFVRQLLELGKERVRVRAFAAGILASEAEGSRREGRDTADDEEARRTALARGAELARVCRALRDELDGVKDWAGVSAWGARVLHCAGAMICLSAEVCSYQWVMSNPER
jgi:hypothetical protein